MKKHHALYLMFAVMSFAVGVDLLGVSLILFVAYDIRTGGYEI